MGDNLSAVDLGTGRFAKSISAYSHVCVVLDNDAIKCWGENGTYGKLGFGDTNNRGDAASEMGDFLGTVDLGPL